MLLDTVGSRHGWASTATRPTHNMQGKSSLTHNCNMTLRWMDGWMDGWRSGGRTPFTLQLGLLAKSTRQDWEPDMKWWEPVPKHMTSGAALTVFCSVSKRDKLIWSAIIDQVQGCSRLTWTGLLGSVGFIDSVRWAKGMGKDILACHDSPSACPAFQARTATAQHPFPPAAHTAGFTQVYTWNVSNMVSDPGIPRPPAHLYPNMA